VRRRTVVDGPADRARSRRLIVTEEPHKPLAYPGSDGEIGPLSLKKLWSVTSLLLDRERISAEKSFITGDSRGMVVNGKFDLLVDAVKRAVACQH
jgi:hypothetical protein